MRYNEKAERGKFKGRFIKKNIKAAIEQSVLNLPIDNEISTEKKAGGTEIEINISNESYTHEGRRIIELGTLAKELWCYKCDLPLSLRHFIAEIRTGLASQLRIICPLCSKIHLVHTNKKNANLSQYDVNYKITIAMYDAGFGEMHINTILSELNIPTLSSATLKRLERVVGPVIEELAQETCEANLKLEIELTEEEEREYIFLNSIRSFESLSLEGY